MKAVVIRAFGPLGSAGIEEIATPVPGPDEVLIDVALAPSNYVDSLVMKGTYQFLPDLPFVPGKGPVGTVREIGPRVTRVRPGDRVLAMAEQGGYAEAVCVDERLCYRLPDGLSFEAAASISLAYDTAWFALVERARVVAGETVLVLGATGAVGSAAVQLARARGARVIAGISGLARRDAVRAAGADAVVDLSAPNLRDDLRRQVHAATEGRGVDIVIDPLGGDVFDAALRTLAWRGRLVVVGFAAGRIPTIKANYLLLKNIEVSGLQISDYRKRLPDLVQTCFDEVFALCSAGEIVTRPVVKYPLAEHAAALTALLDRELQGRAVLVP